MFKKKTTKKNELVYDCDYKREDGLNNIDTRVGADLFIYLIIFVQNPSLNMLMNMMLYVA